jgi:hypothetical protein
MNWLDRILADFGYTRTVPRELPRVQNGTDAVARGQRWEAFATEEGGIYDMISALRRDYFEKVGQLSPGDTAGLQALGMADRIAREIERKVQTVIETGRIRANDRAHAEKISNIR